MGSMNKHKARPRPNKPVNLYLSADPAQPLAANEEPRFEPRARWPIRLGAGGQQTGIRGSPGQRLALQIKYHAGRDHLPVVQLKSVA